MEDLNDILKLSGMQAKVNEAEVEESLDPKLNPASLSLVGCT